MLPQIQSIRQQRNKLNMTQRELAIEVGVSTSMINQIESGRSQPSYETAKKIFESLANREGSRSTHTAGEICSKNIVTMKPNNTLDDAITKMKQSSISQIPIFDSKKPIGVISESGLAEQYAKGNIEIAKKKKLLDIMEPAPPIIDHMTPTNTLAPIIKYSKCILVTKNSKMFGIITAADVLKIVQ